MHAAFIAFYDRWILRRPWRTLALCLGLISLLATQLPHLKLDASADSLVLEGDADLEFFRENARRYSAEEFLIVTYQPDGDLLGDESLANLAALRDELAAVPGVSAVTSILDVPLLQSPPASLADIAAPEGLPTLLSPRVDREAARREFRDSPLYRDLLVSRDGRTSAIQVSLADDERYIELLQRREDLRAQRRRDGLDAAEAAELKAVSAEFKDYSAALSDRRSALVENVRAVVDGYRGGARLFVGGVPMIAADMISFVRSDLVTFGAGILAFMLAALAIIFRQARWVALPIAACVLCALFMLGLLAALDWRMTVISSNFVALLLIVTLAITIHLSVRYRELQLERPDASQHELVLATVRFMSVPCLYTSLTTAVAFVSLVVSGLRPVIDFGWMMTAGIAAGLMLTFLMFPCALVLLPKAAPAAASRERRPFTARFARAVERHGGKVLAASLALLILSVLGISRLQVENRFIDYFHDSTEIYQGMELLDAELGGTIPLDILIDADDSWTEAKVIFKDPAGGGGAGAGANAAGGGTSAADGDNGIDAADGGTGAAGGRTGAADKGASGIAADGGDDDWLDDDDFGGGFDDDFGSASGAGGADGDAGFRQSYWFTVRGMDRLAAIHRDLESRPETGKVLSLATTYALIQQLLGGTVSDVELALVQKGLPESARALLIDPYFNAEARQARITLRAKETSKELRRDEFLRAVRKALTDDHAVPPERLRLSNMLVLYNNVLQSLFQSQILTLGAVFIAIMLMFMALFRSLSLALIAISPNILAAGMVLGAMGLLGIPLDIMTITIAAIVVGIGVDHAIHYVHRFRREFPADRDYIAAMHRCHGSIGRALYYTSITVIAGFSILALSNFRPSIYFGILTGLAMLVAIIGSLLLLPQLILTFKPLGPPASSE